MRTETDYSIKQIRKKRTLQQNRKLVKMPSARTLFVTFMLSILLFACKEDNSDDSSTTAIYSQSSGTVVKENITYSSTNSDESAVKITGGFLTLAGCTITKSGNTTSSDNSSFYGQNAAVLSSGSSSTIYISGGTISTSATGANAIVAYGGIVAVSDVTINCSGQYSRGIHATNSGKIIATNLTATTTGDNSSVIATDKGGGTVEVSGGTFNVSGTDAAVIYSTGSIVASGITGASANGEAVVIEGSNSASTTNCSLVSGSTSRGVLILQSGSGDAAGTTGTFAMTGGSLSTSSQGAPLIEVTTNSTGNITLNGTTLSIASGILMKVDYNNRWTTSGAIGNLALLGNTVYAGNVVADSYSAANVSVNSGTTWNGAFDNVNTAKSGKITLNGGTWTLTGNSNVDEIILTNGAIVNKSGYNLTYTTLTNTSGTIND